jgi:hypothetical protein
MFLWQNAACCPGFYRHEDEQVNARNRDTAHGELKIVRCTRKVCVHPSLISLGCPIRAFLYKFIKFIIPTKCTFLTF